MRDRPYLQVFDRIDGAWTGRPIEGLVAMLALSAIGAELALRDIYRRVFAA